MFFVFCGRGFDLFTWNTWAFSVFNAFGAFGAFTWTFSPGTFKERERARRENPLVRLINLIKTFHGKRCIFFFHSFSIYALWILK